MNIQIENSAWIDIEEDDKGFTISANGTNGNSIEVCFITKKYMKQFVKDYNKLTQFK